jgi:hypothetical protein
MRNDKSKYKIKINLDKLNEGRKQNEDKSVKKVRIEKQ